MKKPDVEENAGPDYNISNGQGIYHCRDLKSNLKHFFSMSRSENKFIDALLRSIFLLRAGEPDERAS
jgi:hypothetical protein